MSGSKWQWLANATIVLIVVLFFAAGTWFWLSRRHEQLAAGDRIATVHGIALDGAPRTVAAVSPHGRHIWLVVAPSCEICQRELPVLERTLDAGGLDLPELTIISLGDLSGSRALTHDLPAVRRRTIVDRNHDLEHAHGRFRVPTMLVLNGRGRLSWKLLGQPADVHVALTATIGGNG